MTDHVRVQLRRIYDVPIPDDGTRVLVDRLWPRGISKGRAQLDEWCKDIAPSPELRGWYHHDPELFGEFSRRYIEDLGNPAPAAALAHLKELARQKKPLILLTASKSPEIIDAAVLLKLLTRADASA